MAKSTDLVGDFSSNKALEDMSFDEMMEVGVIDITTIDDVQVVDQEELVDVPFLLYHWEVKPSETYGGNYALCRVKTRTGTAVFADGGKGIQEQLERYKNKLINEGQDPFNTVIRFPHGLRKSTYTKEVDGKNIPATTYYFDNKGIS